MMQLEDVVVSGVTEFVRIYIILEYFKIFLNVHSLRRNIISCVITYIITLLSYLVFHNVLVNLIVTVAGIIFLSGSFSGKFQKKLLLSIMLYAIMFVIDLLASFLLYEAPDSNNYDIVSSFISVLFFYIVVIGIKNAFKGKGRIDLSGQWYLLLYSALLSIAVLYVVYKDMVVSRIAVLTISIIILSFNLMLYIFYMSMLDRFLYERENLELKQQMNIYERQIRSDIENNRKIAVCGRSMINMIETARKLGYIDCPENIFIDIDMINTYNDEQLVIITTGSQGEPMSALTRMAAGDHRKVKITPNDLVIISANPIPGNEKSVSKVIDDLMQIGAEVVYSALADVHVSGHACQEEQKLIFALAKPKFFIPVHGEYRQLRAHAETAQMMGIPAKNIVMMENGRVVELDEKEIKFNGMVPNGRVLVDGLGVGDVGNIVLRDRQHLSQDGLIVIVLTMDSSTGEVVAGPDVISRGFVYVRESENLMDDVKSVVRHEIKKCEEKGIRDWSTIKSTVRENLRDYIFSKTKRNPMIIPIIMEV